MKKSPVISVVMPVYNTKENDLRMAIESILNQTFSDFEFVIVNDCSTNNAEDVIFSYDDQRIRYIKNKTNLKLIETSNILIREAKCEYVARLDSDDYSAPERLEKQYKYMEEHPEIGVLGTFYVRIPTNMAVVMPYEPDDVELFIKYCGNCIDNSSVMFRKSIVDKYNIKYNPGALHAEDFKFWSDMSCHCRMAVLPEFLTYYRISPDGVSENNKEYQAKMVTVIIMDNMIRDFAADKNYMYSILVKYIKNEPVTDEEFKYTNLFFLEVINYVQNRVSAPHRAYVKSFILSILPNFVREKH